MTAQALPVETCGRRGGGGCSPANEGRIILPPFWRGQTIVVSHPTTKAVACLIPAERVQ